MAPRRLAYESEKPQRGEMASEDPRVVASQPFFEHGGVDRAKISRELQVLVVVDIQIRGGAMDAGFDP